MTEYTNSLKSSFINVALIKLKCFIDYLCKQMPEISERNSSIFDKLLLHLGAVNYS